MSLSTKDLGAQTELQCLAYLHGLGYNVSIPWEIMLDMILF